MGLINGALSYRKFIVTDDLPGNFKDLLNERLPRHAFRDINPKTNPEFSIGWINAINPLDTRLNIEKTLYGKYLILGVRRDKKSLAAALLKAQVSEALRSKAREVRSRKLSREELTGVREAVKATMLAAVSPTTTLTEMVWDCEKREVYYSGTSTKAVDDFVDLFTETFDLNLEQSTLVQRAESFILQHDLRVEMVDLEPSHFGG